MYVKYFKTVATLCKKNYATYFWGETIFFTSPTDGNNNRLKYIYISNATRLAKQVNQGRSQRKGSEGHDQV